MDEAFARIVDDIVIYDRDPSKHADHVRQFLQRSSERRITLNRSKWVYAQPSIEFNLSEQGYHVDSLILPHSIQPYRPQQHYAISCGPKNSKKHLRTSLTTAPTLSYFDPNKPTRLCTDASRRFILQQKNGDQWKLIQAGSRFFRGHHRVGDVSRGLKMQHIPRWTATVVTDHHPLIPILNSHRDGEPPTAKTQNQTDKNTISG